MKWFSRKYEESPKTEEVLRPGICECEHDRCSHERGKGRCFASFPPDKDWPTGSDCACQIFILDDDNDGEGRPETPSPSELEELYKR